ncbi:MAG: hypothetical protein GY821_10560 [Gammaproteobacteria bacterium]|nr:hypothetical protein [Gammaproteobacteria bacterium]
MKRNTPRPAIYSFHAREVMAFNKNKLSKGVEYGRAYQVGRIGGNFLIVGRCDSIHMPDAQSLPPMVKLHQQLFGKGTLKSTAVDKGYYALSNEEFLQAEGVEDIYLPRPNRELNAPPPSLKGEKRTELHNRRAGIEPLIGQCKHGGQLGRSRMRSDRTTLSAGYAAVLGFNLRQLKRHLTGEVRLEEENLAQNDQELTIEGEMLDEMMV